MSNIYTIYHINTGQHDLSDADKKNNIKMVIMGEQ